MLKILTSFSLIWIAGFIDSCQSFYHNGDDKSGSSIA